MCIFHSFRCPGDDLLMLVHNLFPSDFGKTPPHRQCKRFEETNLLCDMTILCEHASVQHVWHGLANKHQACRDCNNVIAEMAWGDKTKAEIFASIGLGHEFGSPDEHKATEYDQRTRSVTTVRDRGATPGSDSDNNNGAKSYRASSQQSSDSSTPKSSRTESYSSYSGDKESAEEVDKLAVGLTMIASKEFSGPKTVPNQVLDKAILLGKEALVHLQEAASKKETIDELEAEHNGELLNAIKDGSFEQAVNEFSKSKLVERIKPQTQKQLSTPNVATSSKVLGKRTLPTALSDVQDVSGSMNTIKRLRTEIASLVDRLVDADEMNAKSLQREAELGKRHADSIKENNKLNERVERLQGVMTTPRPTTLHCAHDSEVEVDRTCRAASI